MITDQQGRQVLREAIVQRVEMLRDEYVHWLNELKKLDEAVIARAEQALPMAVNDFLPPNVVRLPGRG